jgi:chemotaxis protein methyltransferase CheR
MAMMVAETIPPAERADCKILATDIDTNMLATASKGEYTEEWCSKIPLGLRKKYTHSTAVKNGHSREGGNPEQKEKSNFGSFAMDSRLRGNDKKEDFVSYVMDDSLKNLITFKELNLLKPWPMQGMFDAIFCRNVMIYFDKETQATLCERFASVLKIGGYFYIGHSEIISSSCPMFEQVAKTTYQRVQ